MKIEIWSDLMCPFCYIGKKHLEKAIASLPFKAELEIEWKSYQLNPGYHNTENEDLYHYLARSKGVSIAQAEQLTKGVSEMADKADLSINFGKSIPANSFDAHRLVHFAKTKGLQNEAEEALFRAHFVNGKDIANVAVLAETGAQIGLAEDEVRRVLAGEDFKEAVQFDIYESRQLGISSVPYFVFDRKYALTGAQPVETFEKAIAQSFAEQGG